MHNTKKEILDYVICQTRNIVSLDYSSLTASSVSENTNISRSLASQYLNDLYKDGELIKIESRPVYFFHKKTLELDFGTVFSSLVYDNLDEFLADLQRKRKIKSGFSILTGNNGSLKGTIDKIKSALIYPPYGLPMIISGERGTGKKEMLKAIEEYVLENKLVIDPHNIKTLNMLEVNNYQEFERILVGDSLESKGILNTTVREILFITYAELMTKDEQQLLLQIIEKGYLISLKTGKQIDLKTQIVLVYNSQKQNSFLPQFIDNFPVTSHIPNFQERYSQERDQIIISFLKEEAIMINKNIYISELSLRLLADYNYSENINGVKRTVKTICARTNMDTRSEEDIYISLYQLPDNILQNVKEEFFNDDIECTYINVLEYHTVDESKSVLELFDLLLNHFIESSQRGYISIETIEEISNSIKTISDQQTQEYNSVERIRRPVQRSVYKIINDILLQYNISMPNSVVAFITKNIYLESQYNSTLKNWETENYDLISDFLNMLQTGYSDESFFLEVIYQSINKNLEMQLNKMSQIIILVTIIKNNIDSVKRRNLAVIICHGFSTATSIADAVNSILNSYVFDAYDMPIDTSSQDIALKLEKYIKNSSIDSDVLLLVDMGSLEEIDRYLKDVPNKNIGIINNVSTRLALDTGSKIMQNYSIKEILDSAEENAVTKSKLICNKQTKDMIIFTSDNGTHMADRLRKLFLKSLPKPIDVEIVSIDYKDVQNKIEQADANILFVSGTFVPNKNNAGFIPIEEMVTSSNHIQTKLSGHLTPSEMDYLSKSLIKNFSLQNIVSSLTILEPNILLDYVIDSVDRLEQGLQHEISGRTKVGMYIHISCLIERLVTKEPIETSINLKDFIKNEKSFIRIVNESFIKMTQHYRVEIPNSEIAYLFDYVANDRQD